MIAYLKVDEVSLLSAHTERLSGLGVAPPGRVATPELYLCTENEAAGAAVSCQQAPSVQRYLFLLRDCYHRVFNHTITFGKAALTPARPPLAIGDIALWRWRKRLHLESP